MKYDAFISYSQSADGELADALQSGLQRLGRPWYRPRPTMRVFRDKTGFGASEDLTESIRGVLDSSDYLILLLSPQAASSQWVDEEVAHWIAGKESGHVLPVVTHWDPPQGAPIGNLGQFRWDGADVPPALRDYYDTEPLAVDLRWASTGRDLHLRNERFTEAVAEVASPILGKQKDELIGETIRLRRRARRLAIGAIVGLVVLTVAAAVSGLVAVQNARRADERARVAQSRQLAAQATSLAEGDVDVALLLAVEGMRIDSTAEARSALLRTVTRYPGLSLYLHPDRGTVNDLRFAEDGTLAAVSARSTLSVWDPDDPLSPSHLETDDAAILTSFDLHPGAAYAVAGGDSGDLHVFDLPAGIGRLAVPGAHDGRISDVRFLAGGRNLVTAGSDGIMAFWSFQDGTLASDGSVVVGGGVRDLITIEDQDLVVLGLDTGAVEVWSLSERVELGGVTRAFAVNALAYDPASDLLAAGGGDGRVALYRLTTLEEIADLPATRASLISVGTLLFSSDGTRLFAGNADGTIRMWTAPAWAELSTELGGHTGTVTALAASFDGATIASGASDQTVILWDLTSPSVIAEPIHTPKTETGAVAVSTTDLLAVGGVDGAAVWDLAGGEWVLPNLSAFGRPISAIAFDPDGERVAYGALGGDLVVWDAVGDELIQDELGAHSGSDSLPPAVWDVTMDNEVIVSAGTDGAVRMWSEGGVEDLATHPGGATSVDLEGSTLVSAGADIEVHLWRPPGTAVESVLPGAFTAAVAPGEELLALQDPQGGIVLWDLETVTRIGRLWGATAPPTRLSFSPDGSILASGHQNGDILLWDPVSLVAIGGPLRAHNDAVQSIEFHPHGTHLFSGALDGTVMAWDLQVIAWAQEACRVANRDLTEAEWVTYLGEAEPYRATCSTLAEETFGGVGGSTVPLRLPDAPTGASAASATTTTGPVAATPSSLPTSGDEDGAVAVTGDCAIVAFDALARVPCSEPHEFEVVDLVTHPAAVGAPLPTVEQAAGFASECEPGFEAYVGAPENSTPFLVIGIFPLADAWQIGDRTVQCALFRADFSPMTASVEGWAG